MRRNNQQKTGITLIEAVVSAAIAALIFVAVSRLMVSAMQMSRSGSSHLTNLLAADIILQQVLQDLKQATAIVADDSQLAAGELALERHYWEEKSANPGISAVSYRLPEDQRGLIRESEGDEHRLYADRSVKLAFKRVKVGPENAAGIIVALSVSTPPEDKEPHRFRRFVYLESLPENRALINDYLPVSSAAP
ncbi:MAG: hypothetical protein CVV41_16750 [Candidatus Riflebacteria bacterium HGW-Riflebacteria-1]|jgi:hypothetical protein|nr:MAG: hypothetical protein CVV41_16750 [Candidatus Riflebacteria bacterium HGW-Riflebacteria-1]